MSINENDLWKKSNVFPSWDVNIQISNPTLRIPLEGKKGCGHIATHVERKSRFLVAVKLADKRAATMTQATTTSFWRFPKALRQTLAVDNGKEFSRFKELEAKTGLAVYFADPYAAWQRGTNENTNGILRHYYPKGFDFTTISDEELGFVVKKINNRPRKCLGYQTPAEVMRQTLRGALAIYYPSMQRCYVLSDVAQIALTVCRFSLEISLKV